MKSNVFDVPFKKRAISLNIPRNPAVVSNKANKQQRLENFTEFDPKSVRLIPFYFDQQQISSKSVSQTRNVNHNLVMRYTERSVVILQKQELFHQKNNYSYMFQPFACCKSCINGKCTIIRNSIKNGGVNLKIYILTETCRCNEIVNKQIT